MSRGASVKRCLEERSPDVLPSSDSTQADDHHAQQRTTTRPDGLPTAVDDVKRRQLLNGRRRATSRTAGPGGRKSVVLPRDVLTAWAQRPAARPYVDFDATLKGSTHRYFSCFYAFPRRGLFLESPHTSS